MASGEDASHPGDEAPALVPARMVNEVLYCERLVYLEWAQGEFQDNRFTVEGRSVHRRADGGGGKLGAPDDDETAPVARSVWLSSEELGATAKIDIVEHGKSEVTPVEYKRGKQPDVEGGAYLPERAQLCVQVLLLRANGYRCEKAEIFFAADRRRVPIEITDELVATTRDAINRVREVVNGVIPAPLQNSPKCRHCSLAPICLPDEVHQLVDVPAELEAPRPVRRLFPARDDREPLHVQEPGAVIGVRGERLMIRPRDGEPQPVRLSNTLHVNVYGNVQVTTQAMRALLRRGIPCSFFSTGGWLLGRADGFRSNNVDLRIAQYRAADQPEICLDLARRFTAAKIRNCRTLLRRNHRGEVELALNDLKLHARNAERAESVASLLGIEGSAARRYFGELGSLLRGPEWGASFDFNGRNRRPPRDRVNAMLSLGYSLLAKDATHAATRAGLDPLLGFFHRPRFGRPALALDLMEEFRPIIGDSVVLTAVNTGVMKESDFLDSGVGVGLKPAGRRRFIAAYERRMNEEVRHPIFGYRISYRRVLEVQARLLGRVLLGEIEEYPAFRVR